MESFNFYKSLYDRELSKREYLDNAINIPVTILTLLVGLNSVFIPSFYFDTVPEYLNIIFFFISVLFILTSLLFLIKFYNNFFKGFSYSNLATPSQIREFEIELKNYNLALSENEKEYHQDFQEELINRINRVTDKNIEYNTRRGLDLQKAKSFLILTLINSLFLIIVNTIQK